MNTKPTSDNITLWKRIAQIAAIFVVLLSVLVIANYFQISRFDPVNTEVINALVERLSENPKDDALRTQIRELDLLARKAYFTNQWQVKTGGYLLLLAVAVIVIAYQMIDLNRRKQVIPDDRDTLDILGVQKRARKGVLFVGTGILVIAGILVMLTNSQLENSLGERLAEAQVEKKKEIPDQPEPSVPETAAITPVEEKKEDSVQVIKEDSAKVESKEEVAVQKTETQTAEQKKEDTKAEQKEEAKPPVKKAAIASFSQLKLNFPSFRGYGGLGKVYQKNIPTNWDGASGKNILWKAKIPKKGFNSPIIWGNKIFLAGADEKAREVYCYNRSSGKLLWKATLSGIEGSPAKAPKTTPDTGLSAPTMATDGRYVFAIFGTGDVAAFSMDGKMIWGRNLGVPQNHYGHASSLYTYKDKLIVQLDQKKKAEVMALNSETGETVWRTDRKVKASWASPIIINQASKPEIILAAEPTVASYNPQTGKENWKIDCISGEVGPSAAYDNGIVYAMNEYATLCAVQAGSSPKKLWENDEYLSDIPSPLAAKGLLIVPTSYGAVACYNAKTGEKHWEQEFDHNIYASPMLVGEMVYLLDTKGTMHIFKLSKSFEEVASPKLGIEEAVCTPAFANGRIYIRAGGHLFAIGS